MSLLSGIVTRQYAVNEGLPDPNKYLLLGWMLGSRPVGLGVTLALANQEAEQLPPPTSTATQLTITTQTLPNGQVGQLYSAQLASAGGQLPVGWKVTSGRLPSSLTLNPSTGQIVGTPVTPDVGSFTITIVAMDQSNAQAQAQFTFNIAASSVAPLTITTTTLPDGQVGQTYNAQLVSAGGQLPIGWLVTSGQLPSSLTLNPATGQITGTPVTTDAGSFSVTVVAMDQNNAQATATFKFKISSAATPQTTKTSGSGTPPNP